LIYRNVDTKFSYSDDFAIFPHMPRDTPGYDCRAKQILGTWMVSIPAKPKRIEDLPEELQKTIRNSTLASRQGQVWSSRYAEALLDFEQPYEDVSADDPSFVGYMIAGAERVVSFQRGTRYDNCPEPSVDIVDPIVDEGLARKFPGAENTYDSDNSGNQCLVSGGILPERPHWFDLDLTEPPGDWLPRRVDWKTILVERKIDKQPLLESDKQRNRSDRRTVQLLTGRDPWATEEPTTPGPDVRITAALREWALTPVPMGFWLDKPECESKFASAPATAIPLASSYDEASRPRWMSHANVQRALAEHPDAPIYTITPAAQVFTSICINCHGPLADSKGRMADNLADMTGGDTRVANLRDGFFGPADRPGFNRQSVFASAPTDGGVTAEDWAARYLVWMGSGGTQRVIPPAILNAVATTRVMGVRREGLTQLSKYGANMLGVADFLCGTVLPFVQLSYELRFDVARGWVDSFEMYPEDASRPKTLPKPPLALIADNGDAEFWQQLCTFQNPAPVVAVKFADGRFVEATQGNQNYLKEDGSSEPGSERTLQMLFRRSAYPSDTPVGDNRGRVQPGLGDDNLAPWCIERPETPAERSALEAKFREMRSGRDDEPPYCPDQLGTAHLTNNLEHAQWTRRGSMNAGLAVFIYLDALAKGETQRPMEYNRCEQLPEVWP
jgi:mono/diheme cytochrome c family protein